MHPAASRRQSSYAETADATLLVLEGRIVWLQGQILFDTAMAVIDAGRNLVVDLDACTHMDSTLLGTLHELAQRARQAGVRMTLQRVPETTIADFTELSMGVVLDLITDAPMELPEARTTLNLGAVDETRQQLRLLKAHEALAELSEENRAQFGTLVGDLRSELEDP